MISVCLTHKQISRKGDTNPYVNQQFQNDEYCLLLRMSMLRPF